MINYKVQAGDTLGSIAQRLGISVEALARANDIADYSDSIYPGQILDVPDVLGQENSVRDEDYPQRPAMNPTPEVEKGVAAEPARTSPLTNKKNIATAAIQTLPTETKKVVATETMQALSAEDKKDLAERFLPTQNVMNRIWQIIIWAFAIVFVLSALALFVAVYMDLAQLQVLLTVVTTVAGVLAGFISGRTSSGGGSS